MSSLLSRLACWILRLTDQDGITLLPAYIPTHLNVEADFCLGISCFQSGTFSLWWLRQLFTFGAFQRWTSWHFLFFSMPALFHFGNSPASGGLGVECLQPSLEFSGKLSVPPLALVPLVLHFTLSLCQQGFSSFICWAMVGATQTSTSRVYQQCWKEWAGWCAWQGLPNIAISAPNLANFFLYLFQVGLAWVTIGISCSAISAFWSLLTFTGHIIILSFWN